MIDDESAHVGFKPTTSYYFALMHTSILDNFKTVNVTDHVAATAAPVPQDVWQQAGVC